MSTEQGISKELDIGGVVSKTFDIYKKGFTKYLILFAVIEAIIGGLETVVRQSVTLPVLSTTPGNQQQLLNSLPGFFGALATLAVLSAIVTLIFYPIIIGGAVKMASDEIQTGKADLMTSVRFAVSRIVWLWIVGIVVGIILVVGFIALVIPGIILAIMFCLVLPVVVIEKAGLDSLGRSR